MKLWVDYIPYVCSHCSFQNFYNGQVEIIGLKNNLFSDQNSSTIISGNRGNGVSHILHAVCNEYREKGERVIYLTSQWMVHIYKRIQSEIESNDFRDYLLSFDLIVIDNIQFLYRKSRHFVEFIIKLLEICRDTKKSIFLGCSEPEKDFTKMKKYSKVFFFDRIELKVPSSENIFKILKYLCEKEPEIPEKLLYLISEYNGSVQQCVNCLVSIRFKSKAEGISLKLLTMDEIESAFGLRNYFPKQQFRKCFINEQRLLWEGEAHRFQNKSQYFLQGIEK